MSEQLKAELARIDRMNLNYENRIIAMMYAYHSDLERQAEIYAGEKSEYERLKAVHTMDKRYGRNGLDPEKSGEMATVYAESQDDVYTAGLNYRLAEQMIAADKAKLQILHAELEKWRTEQANERAADAFTARNGV